MSSVENIQKSVNQLAAAVAVTNAVTPSPDSSVATTSRRSVDIESLIANKRGQGDTSSSKIKSGRKGGRKKKERKTRKNKGCFSLDLFLYLSFYGCVLHVSFQSFVIP